MLFITLFFLCGIDIFIGKLETLLLQPKGPSHNPLWTVMNVSPWPASCHDPSGELWFGASLLHGIACLWAFLSLNGVECLSMGTSLLHDVSCPSVGTSLLLGVMCPSVSTSPLARSCLSIFGFPTLPARALRVRSYAPHLHTSTCRTGVTAIWKIMFICVSANLVLEWFSSQNCKKVKSTWIWLQTSCTHPWELPHTSMTHDYPIPDLPSEVLAAWRACLAQSFLGRWWRILNCSKQHHDTHLK